MELTGRPGTAGQSVTIPIPDSVDSGFTVVAFSLLSHDASIMTLELKSKRTRPTPLADTDVDVTIGIFTDPEVTRHVCEPIREK